MPLWFAELFLLVVTFPFGWAFCSQQCRHLCQRHPACLVSFVAVACSRQTPVVPPSRSSWLSQLPWWTSHGGLSSDISGPANEHSDVHWPDDQLQWWGSQTCTWRHVQHLLSTNRQHAAGLHQLYSYHQQCHWTKQGILQRHIQKRLGKSGLPFPTWRQWDQ